MYVAFASIYCISHVVSILYLIEVLCTMYMHVNTLYIKSHLQDWPIRFRYALRPRYTSCCYNITIIWQLLECQSRSNTMYHYTESRNISVYNVNPAFSLKHCTKYCPVYTDLRWIRMCESILLHVLATVSCTNNINFIFFKIILFFLPTECTGVLSAHRRYLLLGIF